MPLSNVFLTLTNFLTDAGTPYRLTDHPAEGRTDVASALRGHSLREAAKSMVTQVRTPGQPNRYFLVVVPGDRRIDFKQIERITGGKKASLAPEATAMTLTGCTMGAVPPFSFHRDLIPLIAPDLFRQRQIVFNAARLDCSLWLQGDDFARLARPHSADILTPEPMLA